MSPDRLSSIEARFRTLGQGQWEAVTLSADRTAIRVTTDDHPDQFLRVTRESEPAGEEDVQFIAHAPDDLRCLLGHLRGERRCTSEELDAIRSRSDRASRPPWTAFLKSKGGVGGDSVIWISEGDDEPDLYLWVDSEPAPDAYFEFVAAARQDIPELLHHIT